MRARDWALAGVAALGCALIGLIWIQIFPAGHTETNWCRRSFGRHTHLPLGQILWW